MPLDLNQLASAASQYVNDPPLSHTCCAPPRACGKAMRKGLDWSMQGEHSCISHGVTAFDGFLSLRIECQRRRASGGLRDAFRLLDSCRCARPRLLRASDQFDRQSDARERKETVDLQCGQATLRRFEVWRSRVFRGAIHWYAGGLLGWQWIAGKTPRLDEAPAAEVSARLTARRTGILCEVSCFNPKSRRNEDPGPGSVGISSLIWGGRPRSQRKSGSRLWLSRVALRFF